MNTNGANPKNSRWKKLESWKIELPRETLALAEKVYEYRGTVCKFKSCKKYPNKMMFDSFVIKGGGQMKSQAIHIVDVLFLHGTNMLIENDKTMSLVDRYFTFYFVAM